ncbi:hypothetical protein CEUSTIGMA_g954.t1 [Chlamydomonas eustigma]|uniref:Indoleamine 2,3-dioxygenase n=1 Tax=Chlamydomonas eustigma TaxID=1157962 RepID=A0A250WS60_9CHLO|nr:hypothetical protein CEUSTIGMA_g954.t1 [Chlamydomonas eustigma]|eukprot:GAX73502.1 hypothetical protein CEUSTIGMA_g954.t1 [Chlamydomonas eustigma]
MIVSRTRNTFCSNRFVQKYRAGPRSCSLKFTLKTDIFDERGITEGRGFLPIQDPAGRGELKGYGFEPWIQAVDEIPKLTVASGSGTLRRTLMELPTFPTDQLLQMDSRAKWKAYMMLSFLSHAYMWCEMDGTVPLLLPSRLAVPWCDVSNTLCMPPVLVYATYNLLNWRRVDPEGPIELGNIVCLNNFLGGPDEEHFRLVHVEIEAKAGPALSRLGLLQEVAAQAEVDNEMLQSGLVEICTALRNMQVTLSRMGEKCDPYIYYHRVRKPMSGWRGNPDLPQGLVYEGVSTSPVQLYGETGAQSSIVPAFDAVLGIEHDRNTWLKEYLETMQDHMPPQHRGFIQKLRRNANLGRHGGLRSFCHMAGGEMKDSYNDVVQELEKFRSQHKAFAFNYIAKFSRKECEDRGTGGSDFMPALNGYRDQTSRHLLL